MINAIKGMIIGKINKAKLEKPSLSPTSNPPIITARILNQKDPNHERELLRKHALIVRKGLN